MSQFPQRTAKKVKLNIPADHSSSPTVSDRSRTKKLDSPNLSARAKARMKPLDEQPVQFVHAFQHKSVGSFLNAFVRTQICQNDDESFGAEIFAQVSKDYQFRLSEPMVGEIKKGQVGFAPRQGNIDKVTQKLAIHMKKHEVEKQIQALRLNHNGMLKAEYNQKMKLLQDKWDEVENQSGSHVPENDEIEEAIGIVSKKLSVKTLSAMVRDKSHQKVADQQAKQFVSKIKTERDSWLEHLEKEKKKQEEQTLKLESDLQAEKALRDQDRKKEAHEKMKLSRKKRDEDLSYHRQETSPRIKEFLKKKPLYQQREEESRMREQSELEAKKEYLRKLRSMKQPLNRKEIQEHSQKFLAQRKQLQGEKETKRQTALEDIKKKNEDFDKKITSLYPRQARDGYDENYFEMEAKMDLLKQEQKKEESREYLSKIFQYRQYVKDRFKPQISQKKREELEHAIRERTCTLAKYHPHLPMEVMGVDISRVPVSPKHLKRKDKEQMEDFVSSLMKAKTEKRSVAEDEEAARDEVGRVEVGDDMFANDDSPMLHGSQQSGEHLATTAKKKRPLNALNKNSNNFDWQWDRNVNRLLQENSKPEPTSFHQETMNFLKKRRNTSNILTQPGALQKGQLAEETSIQLQMKKIELQKKHRIDQIKEQIRKENHLEVKEHLRQNEEMRQLVQTIKKTPQKKRAISKRASEAKEQLRLQKAILKETAVKNPTDALRKKEQMIKADVEELNNKLTLLSNLDL